MQESRADMATIDPTYGGSNIALRSVLQLLQGLIVIARSVLVVLKDPFRPLNGSQW